MIQEVPSPITLSPTGQQFCFELPCSKFCTTITSSSSLSFLPIGVLELMCCHTSLSIMCFIMGSHDLSWF